MRKLFIIATVMLFSCSICLAQNKIEPELQDVLEQKSEENISVNIILKSQLDVAELRHSTDRYSDKTTKRKKVIQELKDFAEAAQQDIVSIIKSEESKGNASDVICHWLSNSITCNASKELIERLSKCDNVLLIGYNKDRAALLPADVPNRQVNESASMPEITDNVIKINADKVWDEGYTGEGVLVAILDTGVNYEHPDLADHLWDGGEEYPNHGYNSYDGSKITMDRRGHGTHCAGTICGDGTLGRQTGVAPEATLMCIKALNDEGSANANSLCSGIEFAVEHGADVISMSAGIANSSVSDRTMLRQTCINALEAGVIASVAAGNEGSSQNANPIPNNIRVPASCPAPWIHPDQEVNKGGTSCVVAVGAIDKNDKVASVSSRGPVTWQNTSFGDYPYDPEIGLIRPDISAPGVDIVSLNYKPEEFEYVKMTGTSMAAPCVAGVMCLMLSKKPEMSPAEISMIIETSAVKLADKKNNETGSGIVDALAAINAIDMGDIVFKELSFDDENKNAKINTNENISFNVTFENTSNASYNNIKAVMTCDNEWVNITKAETEITHIAANETISIADAFNLIIDEHATSNTKLYFDVEFFDNNTSISKTRFSSLLYGSNIKYASSYIFSDNNNNNILEAGESASIAITVNNEGNEMAIGLKGSLSSSSEFVSINDNDEISFEEDIAPEGSTQIIFDIALSEDISNIPLELEVKDKYGRSNRFSIEIINSCEITYTLKDEFGDGWNGAKIIAHYSDGSASDTYTITSGYSETFSKTLNSGVEVSLEWKNGGVDTECSYSIQYDNGIEIFNGKGRQKGEFFSWIYDCSCQNMIMKTLEKAENFNISVNNKTAYLTWEAPERDDVVYYEIYRDTELIANTEEQSFSDNNLSSGTYIYNLRPIYENGKGGLSSKEIVIGDNLKEIATLDIQIHPNPSNDKFTIRHNAIEQISVYNVMGETIINTKVDADIFVIDDIKPGIYFVNIQTSAGTAVRKIIKY